MTPVPEIIATVIATPLPPVIVPVEGQSFPEWIIETLKFVGSVKGLGMGGVIVAVCQLAIKGLQVPFFSKKAGKFKLLAIYGLATLGTVLGFILSGVPIMGALLAGPSLAMLQNALHQLWTHLPEKEEK